MQIVIEIDKNLYDRLIDAKQPVFFGDMDSLYKSVVCGTPLPKNHGRLIDYSTLEETVLRLNTEFDAQITRYDFKRIENILFEMPTVIEGVKADGN